MGWVSASDYDRSQPDPHADSMAGIIQHMNADHKDALVLLARSFAHIAETRDLQVVLEDLKSALHEHTERLRQVAVLKLVNGTNGGSPPERRRYLP